MTETELRNKVVGIMKGWLGCKESDGSHRKIIDIYNAHKPLARGYKVQYTDAWCATCVSAAFIQAGLTDIAPTECSCKQMIALYQKLGRWQENDAYVPSIGDVMMYDWDDNGVGDCTGDPDHVGIVTAVNGTTITIIEGNKSDAVAYRSMKVNGRYIRGYCLPDYASKATAASNLDGAVYTVVKGDTLAKIASKYGTTYQLLAEWNGISNPNSISIGQVIFVTEAAAAIGKLGKLGVLNSPDYWQQQVIKNTYSFRPLFIKSAAKIKKAGTRTASAELGIQALVAAGIMDSPDYWRKAVAENKVSGLQSLLCALGGAVR